MVFDGGRQLASRRIGAAARHKKGPALIHRAGTRGSYVTAIGRTSCALGDVAACPTDHTTRGMLLVAV